MCQHKIGSIVFYVIFAGWAVYFAYGVVLLITLLGWIAEFPIMWFLMLAQIASFFIALAAGFLFFHGYRK